LTKHLVFVEAKVQKQLRKMPVHDQERTIQVLNTLEKLQPQATQNSYKELQFENGYKLKRSSVCHLSMVTRNLSYFLKD
jgi:mRNA-degrading endonuclease RelE of RelBE toxin-antitoxin system